MPIRAGSTIRAVPSGVFASNINTTYDQRIYFATYFQDDWKVTPKLTLNLGVRWDYFGPINETSGGQANFVPYASRAKASVGRRSLFPPAEMPKTLSTGPSIVLQLAERRSTGRGRNLQRNRLLRLCRICWRKDGITLMRPTGMAKDWWRRKMVTLLRVLASRIRSTPKLVVRGGFGLFFNSFENQGYGPNIGENYPFVFNLSYFSQSNPAIRASRRRWRRSATTRRFPIARPRAIRHGQEQLLSNLDSRASRSCRRL